MGKRPAPVESGGRRLSMPDILVKKDLNRVLGERESLRLKILKDCGSI